MTPLSGEPVNDTLLAMHNANSVGFAGSGVRGAVSIAVLALGLAACGQAARRQAPHAPAPNAAQSTAAQSTAAQSTAAPAPIAPGASGNHAEANRTRMTQPLVVQRDLRRDRFSIRVHPASEAPACEGSVDDLSYVGFANACALQQDAAVFIVALGGGGIDFRWDDVTHELTEHTLSWILEASTRLYAPGERQLTLLVTVETIQRAPSEPGAYVLSVNDTCLPFDVLPSTPPRPGAAKKATSPHDPTEQRLTCFDAHYLPELRRH
ncbi:MAG: hypothetical protein KC766_40860 [Myxococcales bacterium]|nr:hypothetical protein [Myxococcales bacterium]